jgi:hypothetical protein
MLRFRVACIDEKLSKKECVAFDPTLQPTDLDAKRN